MEHLDLFSGIGGFAYALDQVFYEEEIQHTFVENDPFCQAVLKKHWPEAEIHGDIREFVANAKSAKSGEHQRHLWRQSERRNGGEKGVELITGGFPCQPFSQAGRRKGTDDDRYLWPEMFAAITLYRPRWVIAENVAGLASWNEGLVLETVCSDLESEGYEVQPFVIPAASVGAPHRRDRVWIVGFLSKDTTGERRRRRSDANTSRHHRKVQVQGLCGGCWETDWREVALATCHDGVDDGLYKRLHSAIIESNEHKQIRNTQAFAEDSEFTWESLRGLWEQRKTATPSSYLYQFGLCDTLPDVSCEARQERWYTQEQKAKEMRSLWEEFYSQPHEKSQDVQQRLLDGIREIERNEAVVIKKDDKGVWDVWYRVYLPTSATNGMLKELCEQTSVAKEEIQIISAARHRKERLKACGNAIVPQVAMMIMEGIKEVTYPPITSEDVPHLHQRNN